MEQIVLNPKSYLKREVKIEIIFQVDGTFESMYAANNWVVNNGYDYGSTDALNPTAITIGDYDKTPLPWKWHNFKKYHMEYVSGCITGDNRNGPVTVRIFQ